MTTAVEANLEELLSASPPICDYGQRVTDVPACERPAVWRLHCINSECPAAGLACDPHWQQFIQDCAGILERVGSLTCKACGTKGATLEDVVEAYPI